MRLSYRRIIQDTWEMIIAIVISKFKKKFLKNDDFTLSVTFDYDSESFFPSSREKFFNYINSTIERVCSLSNYIFNNRIHCVLLSVRKEGDWKWTGKLKKDFWKKFRMNWSVFGRWFIWRLLLGRVYIDIRELICEMIWLKWRIYSKGKNIFNKGNRSYSMLYRRGSMLLFYYWSHQSWCINSLKK